MRKPKVSMSPKKQLRRFSCLITEDIFNWLHRKSTRENKSLSVLICEILEFFRDQMPNIHK